MGLFGCNCTKTENAVLKAIAAMEKRLMVETKDRYETVVAKIDAATNLLAARLKADAETIRAGGLTAEQEEVIATRLEGQAEVLRAMGQNSADPVPPVPKELLVK